MNEKEAQEWVRAHPGVSRETFAQLLDYHDLVAAGQALQNLVGSGTLAEFWARHIADSLQLIEYAGASRGPWLDIGSGAGLPGMVTAIITQSPTTLVEPRRLRADFLRQTAQDLGLSNVVVVSERIERMATEPFDVIMARAVAPLPRLLAMAARFSTGVTTWVLPKGKSAREELASLPRAWQGDWAVRTSVTDPDSFILVGTHIRGVDQR